MRTYQHYFYYLNILLICTLLIVPLGTFIIKISTPNTFESLDKSQNYECQEVPSLRGGETLKKDKAAVLQELQEVGLDLQELLNPEENPSQDPIQIPFGGFITNLGQIHDEIAFYLAQKDNGIYFKESAVFFTNAKQSFTVQFPGAAAVQPTGVAKTDHFVNYFLSDFQQSNIPTYVEIWYYDLYPEIDLRYYMTSEGLKYEFIVHPFADPTQIAIQLSDPLILEVAPTTITAKTSQAIVYQDYNLQVFQTYETVVSAQFTLHRELDRCYGFILGYYDNTQDLIIDPLIATLSYSTFLGGGGFSGSNDDYCYGIAIDTAENVYVTGQTKSDSFPIQNGVLDTFQGGSYDAFVTKLNATGNGLVYSTYLGGSNDEIGNSIAIDTVGNAYITGYTDSSDFPIQNGYQSTLQGDIDAFIAKLNVTGNGLVYSTYLGSIYDDQSYDIAIDAAGNACITGETRSADFPIQNGFQSTRLGTGDAFVTKLNSTGNGLVYSTFLGGSSLDIGKAIALDSSANAYITGYTYSSNFPILNPYQTYQGGSFDAFVTKLNSTGNGLIYSTYLGGSNNRDRGEDIAVDDTGNAYITGTTESDNFPTYNPYQSTHQGGSYDAFVTKLNATGNGLNYSTYLGGTDIDESTGIAVDSAGNAYITGYTWSADFPTQNSYQSTTQYGGDAFVTKLDAIGYPSYSTLIGGMVADSSWGIAVDSAGDAYITGRTLSDNFPLKNPYQSIKNGNSDGFVLKLSTVYNPLVPIYSTFLGGSDRDIAYGIALDTIGNVYITGYTSSGDFPTENSHQSLLQGVTDVFVFKLNVTGNGLIYSTYFGGTGSEMANDIAVDSAGNVFITGYTDSSDFPVHNPYQSTFQGGSWDAFVTKLNATGNGLDYSTYLGGNDDDASAGIAVDSVGNVYVTGKTRSANFPIQNGFQFTHQGGSWDAFVTKLNATGNGLDYSTYLGGNDDDSGADIAIDSTGNSYITGYTESSDFPIQNPYQSTLHGPSDAFVIKLNVIGSGAVFSTYLGGSISENVYGLAVDSVDNVYILGSTLSNDFPIHNGFQSTFLGGTNDLFVTKLNATGNGLAYSTYLGGSSYDYGGKIAVDSMGNAYVTGWTYSSDFPSVNFFQSGRQGRTDAFVARLNELGDELVYSTHFGGNGDEEGYDIAVDSAGNVYITGGTSSSDFHTQNPYQSTFQGGSRDTFVTNLMLDDTPPDLTIESPTSTAYATDSITISLSGDAEYYWYYIVGVDSNNQSWTESVGRTFTDGIYTLHAYGIDSYGNEAHISVTFTIDTIPPNIVIDSPIATTYASDSITITFSGDAAHYWYYITGTDSSNHSWIETVDRALSDGIYVLHVYGNDTAGNIASTSISFTIDANPPTVIIDSPTATSHVTDTITVTLSGDAAHYWYYIAGVDSSNQSWTENINRTLVDDIYTLHAYGNDSTGNIAHITVTFTVDTQGPAAPLLSSPLNATLYATDLIDLQWTAPSGDPVQYQILIDDNPEFSSPNVFYTVSLNYTLSLTDGVYYWRVLAIDAAGNWGVWSDIGIFTVLEETQTTTVTSDPTSELSSQTSVSETPSSSNDSPGFESLLVLVVLGLVIFARKRR